MIDTANSNINNKIWTISKKTVIYIIILILVFPSNVNNKCPAIIFAVRRIVKVPGRIMFLMVSIHTINIINKEGVPWGTRWVNICCVLISHP